MIKFYCNKLPKKVRYSGFTSNYYHYETRLTFIKTPWWKFWLPKYKVERLGNG